MSTEQQADFSVIVQVQTVRRRKDGVLGRMDVLTQNTYDVQSVTIDQAWALTKAIRETCRQLRGPGPESD